MKCKISENGLSNVVESIHWTLTRTTTYNDREYTQEIGGITPIPTPTTETFTEYNNLTYEQVVGWIISNTDIDTLVLRMDEMLAETIPTHITLQPPF